MDVALNQMKTGIVQQITGGRLPAGSEQLVSSFQQKLTAVITKALSWQNLKDDYAKLYAETYTEDELDGMIAFYKTPAGKAMVEKSPTVAAKANQVSGRKMQDAQPEMRKVIGDFAAEIQKLRGAPAKP